jgi:DNA-binding CsgD family transcriptional regulator
LETENDFPSAEVAGIDERIVSFSAEYRLSPREREVLTLLLRGVHPKAMSTALGCQYASVRTHLGRICRKVRCSGARELVLRFFAGAGAARTKLDPRSALA